MQTHTSTSNWKLSEYPWFSIHNNDLISPSEWDLLLKLDLTSNLDLTLTFVCTQGTPYLWCKVKVTEKVKDKWFVKVRHEQCSTLVSYMGTKQMSVHPAKMGGHSPTLLFRLTKHKIYRRYLFTLCVWQKFVPSAKIVCFEFSPESTLVVKGKDICVMEDVPRQFKDVMCQSDTMICFHSRT